MYVILIIIIFIKEVYCKNKNIISLFQQGLTLAFIHYYDYLKVLHT